MVGLGMIRRPGHLAEVQRLLRAFPVVAIVGARQAGKTTLAQMLMSGRKGPARRYDLEDPRDVVQLSDRCWSSNPFAASSSWMRSIGGRSCFQCSGSSPIGGRSERASSFSGARHPIS